MSIKVENGVCPVNGRMTYGLYEDGLPIVPATVFLRHLQANLEHSPNTVAATAYALKIFFSFLADNALSFWDTTPATVRQYKRIHLYRLSDSGGPLYNRRTVRQYLSAVKGLVRYWLSFRENDPLFGDHTPATGSARRRGRSRASSSTMSLRFHVPDTVWRVGIHREAKNEKNRYKGLSRDEMHSVSRTLEQVSHQTDCETMLYYRNRAIWKFLLMTLLRKGELVRVRLEDLDVRNGIVRLTDRPEDGWLGELKTGPADIFVAPNNPFWGAVTAWLTEGRWIAEKLLERKGKQDHGLLFCNRDGGPLTQSAVDHLFAVLKQSCKLGRRVNIFPHITRHTMASLLLDSGMDLEQVQRMLRHRSVASTGIYAKVSDTRYREALTAFWRGVKEGL